MGKPWANVPVHIYVLREPGTSPIRYVGATQDLKKRAHLRIQQTKFPTTSVEKWMASLAERGLAPEAEVVEIWHVGRDARMAERWLLWNLIARGEPVLNELRWDVCDLDHASNFIAGAA